MQILKYFFLEAELLDEWDRIKMHVENFSSSHLFY